MSATTGYLYVTYATTGQVSGQINSGGNDIVVYQLDTGAGMLQWSREQPSFNTTMEDIYPSITNDASP